MAFGTPEYCCSGEFNTPATCRPSVYSEIFKSACPKSYNYGYDDVLVRLHLREQIMLPRSALLL
uniref:Uncharacterized protein n=1 Tax=Nelumbo nucifera TaxID=4432 RepID=A0A822ZPJ1_NELNU|nr:TPA_asm: hypothetical protein HUJ06_016744 [Nelumbo nucifera]